MGISSPSIPFSSIVYIYGPEHLANAGCLLGLASVYSTYTQKQVASANLFSFSIITHYSREIVPGNFQLTQFKTRVPTARSLEMDEISDMAICGPRGNTLTSGLVYGESLPRVTDTVQFLCHSWSIYWMPSPWISEARWNLQSTNYPWCWKRT